MGPIDDVMNVAGHGWSNYEIESALVDNPKVAEAAVVSKLIGKIDRPHGLIFTDDLPKTRSGKKPDDVVGEIMRRLLRDVARGRQLGDVTTLANAEVVDQIPDMAETGAGEE
ncbi:MAG: hypothetical protein ACT4PO_06330 [Actinomycetota bacterium]